MAVLDSIENAIKWLEQAKLDLQEPQPTVDISSEVTPDDDRLAWGAKVSPTFKERVKWIADTLGCPASHLMACMAWESGETFRADIRNGAGSGATGLIQFMPSTAKALGTTVAALAAMTPEDQLRFVYEYFKPYQGRLHNLGDIYMAILWPGGVEKPLDYVLFDKRKVPTAFRQNSGLDLNKDGLVTKAECLVKVNEKLTKGMQEGYVG